MDLVRPMVASNPEGACGVYKVRNGGIHAPRARGTSGSIRPELMKNGRCFWESELTFTKSICAPSKTKHFHESTGVLFPESARSAFSAFSARWSRAPLSIARSANTIVIFRAAAHDCGALPGHRARRRRWHRRHYGDPHHRQHRRIGTSRERIPFRMRDVRGTGYSPRSREHWFESKQRGIRGPSLGARL